MDEIPSYVKKLINTFDSLRGKPVKSSPVPFWDVVVLTASDELQKEAFQLQIENKLSRGRLPTGIPYLVFADPPGPRAGCGTSTMNVICELVKSYGWEKLNTWRVLLLNAGGQSQRLPSASVLGKIFTALPIAGSDYQMLDLKLALYLPFLKRMSPGVFHPASDCVEVFAMDEDDVWNFTEPGITALAHPSSLKIGATHGVYVLEKSSSEFKTRKTEFRTCLKVLQKPSISKMREEEAVLTDSEDNEFVYTDSLFFFDHDVSKRLCDFYLQEAPMNCEIDSYGDFLQPLGPRATIDYTLDTANVGKVESNLVDLRQKIYNLLHGMPLHIVALNASKFYHFGTFGEYLYHFTEDEIVAKEMNFTRVMKSKITGRRGSPNCNDSGDSPLRKRRKDSPQGILIHSSICEGSVLPERCLVEYSHFAVPLELGTGTVISNCEYLSSENSVISIPADTFLHTISVYSDEKVLYTTLVFNINDNLKKSASFSVSGDLTFYGLRLEVAIERLGYDKAEVFSGKSNDDKCSLWGARLFPGFSTMTESFETALSMISQLAAKSPSTTCGPPTAPLFSMVDVMSKKNVTAMLHFRNKLEKMVDG